MIILLFAGAGSVGKTATLDAIVEEAKKTNIKIAIHKSSTRKTYANANLTSESQALKDEEFNKLFQEQVFKDNSEDLLQAIVKAKEEGVEMFFADRTPYDYIAYYFTVFQSSLTISLIKEKRSLVAKLMKQITDITGHVGIMEFPFPAHWSEDTESSDGWRADKTGKNFVWSSVLAREIRQAYTPIVLTDEDTAEKRAFIILNSF